MGEISIEEAIESFGLGFSYGRSITHPFLFGREGKLWVLRDAPRKSGSYRRTEAITVSLPPAEVDAELRRVAPNSFLCAIALPGESGEELVSGFKALGYRLLRREPFMISSTAPYESPASPFPIVRLTTREEAEVLGKLSGHRVMQPQDITDPDPTLILYYALDGARPIGWVKSIRTRRREHDLVGTAWVSSMYVHPDYRRRGLGVALMKTMLAGDRERQIDVSVLLASNAGSKLYDAVGYEQIGLLHLFAPPKDHA